MHHRIRFVGGPQDGKTLEVPGPVSPGLDLLVRPPEPFLPWDPYRLGEDGRFHHVGYVMDLSAARAAGGAPGDPNPCV